MVESERSNVCMFHLRRVQFQTFIKDKGDKCPPINDALEPSVETAILGRSTMILLDKQTKIGRNPELVDVVLHSVVHSNMISRDHSEIVGFTDDKGKYVRYLITDRSLNGTYVNDTRVNIQQQLKEGDLIKFGHVNGAAIKAGEYAPQQSAEFIFRFERALSNYNYFGYTKKRVRLHSEHKRAYMQISSDLVLPTEVYSCVAVPKALPPSSGTLSGPSGSSMNATIPAATVSVAPDSTTNNSNSGVVPPTMLTTPSSIAATIPVSCNISYNGTNGFLGTNTLPNTAVQNASTQNHQQQQLAQLAAFAAATTAVTNSQQQQHSSTVGINSIGGNTSTQPTTNQQQQALNALNQLGLGTVTAASTEEQVAAVNAQLRSIMASHDAMERLAAQQQWQKSLFNLNSLQQQNPLIYGHAFPAAAAAAAALFSGMGGIDLNTAAANPTAYAAAASLWPNIRASLQPTSQDWTQQQQKAATLAHQLQLRLPPVYQQQSQQQSQNQLAIAAGGQRAASVSSAVSVASSLFGAPSAFSLPSHNQLQTAASVPPNSTNSLQLTNNAVTSTATTVGLLVTAQPSQNQALSNLSNASAAYSSCTSSTNHPSMLGFRTGSGVPISRGASSSSLTQPTTSATHTTQLNFEDVEAKVVTSNGWPSIGEGFINSSSSKVSPILAAAAAAAANARGGNGTSTPNDLQRIPDIASALAAAFSAAQQQQQANNNNGSTSPISIPISVSTSTSKGITTSSLQSNSSTLSITPSLQHSLAQRLLTTTPISSSSNSNNSTTLNCSNDINKRYTNSCANSNFSSSSGISSASSASLLQSPSAIIPVTRHQYEPSASTSDAIASPPSSLNSSGASSAFSTPAQQHQNNNNGNITNLSTLTAALFTSDKVNNNTKRPSTDSHLQQQNLLNRRLSGESRTCEEKSQQILSIDNESNLKVMASLNNSTSILSPLSQSEQQQRLLKNTIDESKITRLMECDSSVPSPPSKREDDDEELKEDNLVAKKERREENKNIDDNENEHMHTEAGDIFRKRHSDSISIKSSDGTKPPTKHARKSNEVARLLNDLTAGNCSWQYMAERQQKSILKGKDKGNFDKNMKTKKPLRLEERKQMRIDKNNAHTMLRQISESESSGEEEKEEKVFPLVVEEDKESDDDTMAESEDSVDEEGEIVSKMRIDSESSTEKKQKLGPRSSNSDISDLSFHTYLMVNETERQKLDDANESEDKKIVSQVKAKYGKKDKNKLSSDDGEDEDMVQDEKVFQPPPQPRKNLAAPTKRTTAASSMTASKVAIKQEKNPKATVAITTSKKAGEKKNTAKEKKTTKEATKDKEKLPVEKLPRGRKPKKEQQKEDVDETSNDEMDVKIEDKEDEIDVEKSENVESDVEKEAEENVVIPKASTQKKVTEKKNVAEKKTSAARGRSKQAVEPEKEKKVRKTASKTIKKTKKKDSTSDDSDDHIDNIISSFEEDTEESTVMEDWTGGAGDPELCHLPNCKRPKDMKILWVQCEKCNEWFHSICVLGKNIEPKVEHWYCDDCD